jgi:predicted N-acetyltransferase YhbS
MTDPENSIHIRRATPEDAPDLARILIETNRATFEGLVPDHCLDSPTREESIRNWKRALSSDRVKEGKFTLVAENTAGHIVGYTVAGGETGRSDYERELNVLMIGTTWHRRGIGRALISAVVKKLS